MAQEQTPALCQSEEVGELLTTLAKCTKFHKLHSYCTRRSHSYELPDSIVSAVFAQSESLVVAAGSSGYLYFINPDKTNLVSMNRAHNSYCVRVHISPTNIYSLGSNEESILRHDCITFKSDGIHDLGSPCIDFAVFKNVLVTLHVNPNRVCFRLLSETSAARAEPLTFVPRRIEHVPSLGCTVILGHNVRGSFKSPLIDVIQILDMAGSTIFGPLPIEHIGCWKVIGRTIVCWDYKHDCVNLLDLQSFIVTSIVPRTILAKNGISGVQYHPNVPDILCQGREIGFAPNHDGEYFAICTKTFEPLGRFNPNGNVILAKPDGTGILLQSEKGLHWGFLDWELEF